MLKCTWEHFVNTAFDLYRVNEYELEDQMQKVGISKIDALCYLNFQPEYGMTEEQIGKELRLKHHTVSYHIEKIRNKWPHIFATNETFRYDPERDDHRVIKKY